MSWRQDGRRSTREIVRAVIPALKSRISDQLVHARFAESMLVISIPSMSNRNAAKCRPSWGTTAGAVFEMFFAQGHTDCLAAFKVRNIVEQAIGASIVPI